MGMLRGRKGICRWLGIFCAWSLGKRRRLIRRRVCCWRVPALGPRASSLFPAGAGGGGGREGPPASVPRGGAQLALRHHPPWPRRRLGAGPPLSRPFPRFGPSPPARARARTHASPGSMQMRYPEAGGPGGGGGGGGWSRCARPSAHPAPVPGFLARSCARRPRALPSGPGSRAQTPSWQPLPPMSPRRSLATVP